MSETVFPQRPISEKMQMFKFESELQKLVHDCPEIVLNGIPEISPYYCSDAPPLVSLGRETPLNSGPIDNLFIDANGILTLVECKRYCDSRLKRDVYSQAINYASDLQNMLRGFNGPEFLNQFFTIVSKSQGNEYKTFDQLLAALAKAPMLQSKDIANWQIQFKDRLEFNVKKGVFRIIILCGPSSDSHFSSDAVRNLMQSMTFAEKDNAIYDLLLMDIRESGGDSHVSKIIWRRYAPLPQIPLFASISRDTSRAIDAMRVRRIAMAAKNTATEESLVKLLNMLDENDYIVEENTSGLAIYRSDKKSIFTAIRIDENGWCIVRHQIRKGEALHSQMELNPFPKQAGMRELQILKKKSSATDTAGVMYEIVITPNYDISLDPKIFHELAP